MLHTTRTAEKPASYSLGIAVSYPGHIAVPLDIVPSLRMRGAKPQLPQYALMAWSVGKQETSLLCRNAMLSTGTVLPLLQKCRSYKEMSDYVQL
jgi:hypothetical protein